MYPMLPVASLCVLCPMLPKSIFMCLVSNITRVYLSVSCAPNVTSVYLCLVPNVTGGFSLCLMASVTRVYLYVSMCLMLHVSIFLCLVPNVTRVYLSLSCVQCYTCLSFCVLSSMLPVCIFHWTQDTERSQW
jgi:multisubunit Na+/H+ antiporter MnhC subunit